MMGVSNCRDLTNEDLVSKDGRMFSITNEVAGGILLSTFSINCGILRLIILLISNVIPNQYEVILGS